MKLNELKGRKISLNYRKEASGRGRGCVDEGVEGLEGLKVEREAGREFQYIEAIANELTGRLSDLATKGSPRIACYTQSKLLWEISSCSQIKSKTMPKEGRFSNIHDGRKINSP